MEKNIKVVLGLAMGLGLVAPVYANNTSNDKLTNKEIATTEEDSDQIPLPPEEVTEKWMGINQPAEKSPQTAPKKEDR